MYALAFAIYGSVFIYNVILTTIANGVGYLKTQLICYSIGAIAKVPIIIVLNKYINSWIIVVFVNIFILTMFCIVQTYWLNKFIKVKLNKSKE